MSDNTGAFVWYEWMGEDLQGASDFYAHVVGWKMGDPGLASFPYKVGAVGDYGVVGMLTTPPEARAMGAPPCWTGYVWVENVDAGGEKLQAEGGAAFRPAMDIPNVGRFALVADSQGAAFMLFREAGGDAPRAPPPETPGLVGWRELHAGEGKSALDFYTRLFGWKEASQFDMGPMGVYRLFESRAGQQGGIMTKAPQGPGPCWLFYFNVEAADAAGARVAAKGGKVVNGPHEVPGGLWAMQCVDGEGAMFGLVAPKR
jgi:predicted enzyme related to lactoylglutathione lyase